MDHDILGRGWAWPIALDSSRPGRVGRGRPGRRAEHRTHPEHVAGRAADAARVRLRPASVTVFAPSDGATAGAIREAVDACPGPLGATNHGRGRARVDARRAARSTSRSATSFAPRTSRATSCFPFTCCPTRRRSMAAHRSDRGTIMSTSCAESRRPPLPGVGRRCQASRSATVPIVDQPQRFRPRRHAHRDVRLHGRPGPLPPQPRPGPPVHQVHGPDRRPAVARACRPRADHLLAFEACRSTSRGRRRARRSPLNEQRSRDSISFWTAAPLAVVPCAFRAAVSARRRAGQPSGHGRRHVRRGHLAAVLQRSALSPARPSPSGSPTQRRRAPCCCTSKRRSPGSELRPDDPPIVWEALTPYGLDSL